MVLEEQQESVITFKVDLETAEGTGRVERIQSKMYLSIDCPSWPRWLANSC